MSYDDLLPEDKGIKKNLGFQEKGVTYVGLIDDHSGSMTDWIDDEMTKHRKDLAMSNFNEQIATLKKEADEGMEVLATVVEFDNEIECVYDNVDIEDVAPMLEYWTRGMTSLYDAIAYGISKIKKRMDDDPREDKAALMVIETDGYENSSQDYSHEDGRERLKKLIEELEETGKWTFTFLGAGLDKKFASSFGMAAGNVVAPVGMRDTVFAYTAQSDGMKNFMGARKSGEFQTKTFYSGDHVNDNSSDDKDKGVV